MSCNTVFLEMQSASAISWMVTFLFISTLLHTVVVLKTVYHRKYANVKSSLRALCANAVMQNLAYAPKIVQM